MDKQRLSAVHDRDLDLLLTELGIASKLKHGRLRCATCASAVTTDNLGALFYDSGQVKVVCDEFGCLDLLRVREVTE